MHLHNCFVIITIRIAKIHICASSSLYDRTVGNHCNRHAHDFKAIKADHDSRIRPNKDIFTSVPKRHRIHCCALLLFLSVVSTEGTAFWLESAGGVHFVFLIIVGMSAVG